MEGSTHNAETAFPAPFLSWCCNRLGGGLFLSAAGRQDGLAGGQQSLLLTSVWREASDTSHHWERKGSLHGEMCCIESSLTDCRKIIVIRPLVPSELPTTVQVLLYLDGNQGQELESRFS